jgi:Tfp pilus assembly protein PilO
MDIALALEKIISDKKKLLLVIIMGGVVIYADFAFILTTQMRSLNNTKVEMAKTKNNLDNLNRELALMRDNKLARESDINSNEIKKAIPEGGVAILLEIVSGIANKYKIKILQMKPGYESRENPKSAKVNKLLPLTITIELNADYHNLGRFIKDLEDSEYFMAVDELKINAEQNNFIQQKIYLSVRSYAQR